MPLVPNPNLGLRVARDRLINILGLGRPYPIQDLSVQDEQLTVDFDQPTAIDIVPGQHDVRYRLDENNAAVTVTQGSGPPQTFEVDGNGGTTVLKGPPITADHTYQIRAYKPGSPEIADYLVQTALVKVGLDASLAVSFATPGVAVYGSTIGVIVAKAQPLVSYQLVYTAGDGTQVTTDPVTGAGANLTLSTKPVQEDTKIQVKATRTFDASEGRPPITTFLDATLQLAVRANPALAVSIDGSPLVDPTQAFTVTVAGTQKSVTYSVFARTLLDADFEVAGSSGVKLLDVPVPASLLDVAAHDVLVHDPPRPVEFQVQPGYAQQGAEQAGTGAALKFSIGPLADDTVLMVRAHKNHPGATPAESATQLVQALVALPRPGPAAALSLALTPASDGTSGSLLVTGGQLGVFYHLRRGTETAEVGLPAYFHRVDETNSQVNHGVGQNRVGRDVVVTRDPPAGPPADLSRQRPLPPLVNVAPLPVDGTLSVMAVRARSGVGWTAPRTVPATKTP